MPLELIESFRGNPQLSLNGFLYTKERQSNEKTIWRCVEYNRVVHHIGNGQKITSKCGGRVHTVGDNVTFEGPHNHLQRTMESSVKKVMIAVKRMARETTATPQAIVSGVSDNVDAAVAAKLPPIAVIKRNIQRVRQTAPAPPTDLLQLEIPENYQVLKDNVQFLLHDSGPGQQRFLMFGTQESLERMASCQHWYADGTFKVAPQPFQQVFTVHAIEFNNVIPSVYFLLPDNQQGTYDRALQALKDRVPKLAPVSIMTNFEMVQSNAFNHCFPGITNRGCFFHFCQCIWRAIQRHEEIQKCYLDTAQPRFQVEIRKLAALAFVPVKDVIEAFNSLLDSEFFCTNAKLLNPLTDYFSETWIGLEDRREQPTGRRQPTIAHALWNCYEGTLQDLLKTNNSVEGWHRSFSSLLGARHQSLWNFIDNLKKEEAQNQLRYNQSICAMAPDNGRKRYKDTAAQIKTLVLLYNTGPTFSVLEYLEGIAHYLELQA